MQQIHYLKFDAVEPADFLPILNNQKIRAHLIDHPDFDLAAVGEWMEGKQLVDGQAGCRVRAILVDGQLAGWCGLQFENGQHEVAIVLDDGYWGLGKRVFSELLAWARDFGHETVCIHFLSTRPEYSFMKKIAQRVYESEMFGARFISYEISTGSTTPAR